MSGRGKRGILKAKQKRRCKRLGLQFSIGRVLKHLILKSECYVSADAAIFTAAILQLLTLEFLERAGNAARKEKKRVIVLRHLQLLIKNHKELYKACYGIWCYQRSRGTLPNIEALFPPTNTE